MAGTKIPVNGGCVIEHDTSLSFAQNLRDTVVNFVKIILLLTFLPTGASDVLGPDYVTAEVKSTSGDRANMGRTTQSVSVLGGTAILLCNTTAPSPKNPPILVIWYKNGGGDPVYSYDLRRSGPETARHWTDSHVLGGRASFQMAGTPARLRVPGSTTLQRRKRRRSVLRIRDVAISDRGMYRCRVDFQGAPTRNSKANLTVIVPPKRPVIVDESGIEASTTIGPYAEGVSVEVSCEVSGGRPKPVVRWFQSGIPLPTSSEVSSGSTVTSTVLLETLGRSDNGLLLTCEASNNNISKPVRHSVSMLMNLAPTALWISKKEQHLLAGTEATYPCFSVGAYPQNRFTWYLDNTPIQKTPSKEILNKVISNSSYVHYVPKIEDNGKELVCESDNPDLPGSALRDSLVLDVHYIPKVHLEFGKNLDTKNIKEGDDAYFECHVEARPEITKIQWMHNNKTLKHNVTLGIIISNQSLVLQTLERNDAGSYVCKATNAEGTSSSNKVDLNIKYAPICASVQPTVLGVASNEHLEIACDVKANPNDLKFHWTFNNRTRNMNYNEDFLYSGSLQKRQFNSEDEAGSGYLTSYISNGTRSILTYSPGEERQYGTILCFANNNIGRQKEACAFHLIPAGRPEPVHNCTQIERSQESIMLKCSPGFDGGLAQLFTLELRPWSLSTNPLDNKGMMMRSNSVAYDSDVDPDTDPTMVIRNVTSSKPTFYVKNLKPGTRFEARVYTSNQKGRSDEVFVMRASTLKRASDKRPVTSLASGAATNDNALMDSGGELISSSVSHRDSSSVLKNGNSDGTSLSSSDGSSSSITLSGLIGNFPMRTVLMIVGSFALVLTVVAVSIGVICRIQFRSMPSSSSPPCVIQRVNNGSQSSDGHGKRGSRGDDEGGRDKRVVLLSINGGGSQRNRGTSQESLTGDNIDNDRHSLSVASVATSDDRAMMQLQRVASTTTVMMAMTTASTPGDSDSDGGLLGTSATFTSDLRRFSVPSQDINQICNKQQLNGSRGSLEHQIQHPTSLLSLSNHPQKGSYHLDHNQGSAANSFVNHHNSLGQSTCIEVPIKRVEAMKIPIQLQNQNIQIQHPYHHHNSQSGKPPSLMLDAARLSNDPQKSGNESEVSNQQLQRVQTSLTLPLDRYHYPGNSITSAAMVHHNHPTPMNPQHFLDHSSSNMFQTVAPNMDGTTGRITLSTFSPSNPNFPGPSGFQTSAMMDDGLPLPAPPDLSLLSASSANTKQLVPSRQNLCASDVYSPPPPSLSSTSSSFSGASANIDHNKSRHFNPGGINTFPRRMPDPSFHANRFPPHLHLSPNASHQRPKSPSNARDQSQLGCNQGSIPIASQLDRNMHLAQDNTIQMQDMSQNPHRNSFKQKFDNTANAGGQLSSTIVSLRTSNLKSSHENLVSSDHQQRMVGQVVPLQRKTVTFKGDVQTIECSPEEQQDRRCWRHQSSTDANADDFSDEDDHNNSDTQNQSETNGSGDSSEGGEEKDLVESRV